MGGERGRVVGIEEGSGWKRGGLFERGVWFESGGWFEFEEGMVV